LARICLFDVFRFGEPIVFDGMWPLFFSVRFNESTSLISFAARERGTPNLSAVSIAVANRDVIFTAIDLNSFYIFESAIPT